jgi:hypothetical protein
VGFAKAGKVSAPLGKGTLLTGGINERIKELKTKNIVLDISEFAKWREEHGGDPEPPSQPPAKRPRLE